MITARRAVIELILAGALWGFGFVATAWALTSFSAFELLILRFFIAVIVGEMLWFIFSARFRHEKFFCPAAWVDFKLAIPAGILMAGFLLPQTIGLQYTTASKSGFLTTLYVIMVPILNHLVFKVRTTNTVYVYAFAALVGAFLLMDADLTGMNPGDLWTVLCAFLASWHILYIGRIGARIQDSFRYNTFQSFLCLICLLPFLLTQEKINFTQGHGLAWAGILSLALGSSIIGFTIQIRTQKVLSAMTASMLFLLESPFALIFGILLLQEKLNAIQAGGAALILVAAAMTVKSDSASNSK